MDASIKPGADSAVSSEHSDITMVCQEVINELLKKTTPAEPETETNITLPSKDDELHKGEGEKMREDDCSIDEEEKELDKASTSCRESNVSSVVRPQSPKSRNELHDQHGKNVSSDLVPGTSMTNILVDIGMNVISDFMRTNPSDSPKEMTKKASESKGVDSRQQGTKKKYYCQECPAYYYDLGCMCRHLKNAHKLFIPKDELRNYYRRTTIRQKVGKEQPRDKRLGKNSAVGIVETNPATNRIEGNVALDEKVTRDSTKSGAMLNYRCMLCSYVTTNYAKLLHHVQALHGRAHREQGVNCKTQTVDAEPKELQQSSHNKLEDFIALACPFCEERPEDMGMLKDHLRTVHNMSIVDDSETVPPPTRTKATEPEYAEDKIGEKQEQEKTDVNQRTTGCSERDDTSVPGISYSLSKLMPLVCKLCSHVHMHYSSFVRHMRYAHNIYVHCQENYDIPLSGQYFNGRDCRFCGYVARDKTTFFVHLGHYHKMVHYALLGVKQKTQLRSECITVNKSGSLRCFDCGFTTADISSYQRHRLESHISKSDQLKTTNEKDATSASKDTIKCAVTSLPATKGKKRCDECGEAFTYAYEKDYHIFKVHKNKQKEEPVWGRRKNTRGPLTIDTSLPVKKEADKKVKTSRKRTKRKYKETKGNKEVRNAGKAKRRKLEEPNLDLAEECKDLNEAYTDLDEEQQDLGEENNDLEDSFVMSKVERTAGVDKTATKKKCSSNSYKHKKTFLPANETSLKEWEHILKASYACDKYPSREEIHRLAVVTGQEFALIRTWFAYERQNQNVGPRPRNVYRKNPTDHTAYMEEELQKNPKPTMQDVTRIAEKTGLSVGLVMYWFNKRLPTLKLEQQTSQTESSSLPASAVVKSSLAVSTAEQSSSKEERKGFVQLKVPKMFLRDGNSSAEIQSKKKPRQFRRKGIPKKKDYDHEEDSHIVEQKERDVAADNRPEEDSCSLDDMTESDVSFLEEAGDGTVQQKWQRQRTTKRVSKKVTSPVTSDNENTASSFGRGESTFDHDSKENNKRNDKPKTQSNSTSPPCQEEKQGQNSDRKSEKATVIFTLVSPMNLKAQREAMVMAEKGEQQKTEESVGTVHISSQNGSGESKGTCALNLSVKAKEAFAKSSTIVPSEAQSDGKPVSVKTKISHQKARALANMIPYYCCLVCDPAKSKDKQMTTAFTQYEALTKHLREKHSIRSRYEKHFTIKKFPNVKTNTQEQYQCQYCPIYYHMPGFLVRHLRDQHGVNGQIVKGSSHFEIVKPDEMKNVGSVKVLKTPNGTPYVNTTTTSCGQTVTQYHCALCPQPTTKYVQSNKTGCAFLQYKALEEHLRTIHNVTSDFKMYCTSQQIPVLEINKEDVAPYAKHRCKLCNLQYNHMGYLARHLEKEHRFSDLNMKWTDIAELIKPEMRDHAQDSSKSNPSSKLSGKPGTKGSSEKWDAQEQQSTSRSVVKPARTISKMQDFPSDLPPSPALDSAKRSLTGEQLSPAQSGHVIYQCTLCKSFFRFYTNATDHLATKHSMYGADCAKHIAERSAKIVESGRHQQQENFNSTRPSPSKGVTVSDSICPSDVPSEAPELLPDNDDEGDKADFSILDAAQMEEEGVIYECLKCKAIFPKWVLLVRHHECCTWDSSLHFFSAVVRMPKEVVESFFATSGSGFECSFCGLSVQDWTKLAPHLQTHTKQRVLLTCIGEEDGERKSPIATSAEKIAQYTVTPISQTSTVASEEDMPATANQDTNQKLVSVRSQKVACEVNSQKRKQRSSSDSLEGPERKTERITPPN